MIERADFLARRKDRRVTDVIDLNDWSAEDRTSTLGRTATVTDQAARGQERTSIFVFIWLASKLFPAHLLAPLD